MGELLSICCGRKTNDSQPTRTYGGGGASDLYNIRDPAYVTDNHPGGCDGNGCGNGDGGGDGGDGGCGG